MKYSYRLLSSIITVMMLFVILAPDNHASTSIIIDNETGCILEGKGINDKLPIASLTKIAVAVTLLDWIKLSKTSLDTKVEVPAEAPPQGIANPLGLQSGDHVALRDLIYLSLLVSDSEAALTIANYVGQKLPNPQNLDAIGNFVSQLNALAFELDMKRTLFLNPHGLPMPSGVQQPYSTAADLARLTRYAYSKSGFAFYASQKSRDIHVDREGKNISVTIENTNKLLGVERIDGVKTAHSTAAGDCIVLTSNRDPEVKREGDTIYTTPRRIIVVLLGSIDRFQEGLDLDRRGWALYDTWAAAGRPTRSSKFL